MELSVFSDEPVTENEVGVLLSDLEMSLNAFAQQQINDPFFPFVANQTVTIEGKLYCISHFTYNLKTFILNQQCI